MKNRSKMGEFCTFRWARKRCVFILQKKKRFNCESVKWILSIKVKIYDFVSHILWYFVCMTYRTVLTATLVKVSKRIWLHAYLYPMHFFFALNFKSLSLVYIIFHIVNNIMLIIMNWTHLYKTLKPCISSFMIYNFFINQRITSCH